MIAFLYVINNMRYTYQVNDQTIEAMSFKKMLKALPGKFKPGEVVQVQYKNKKNKLINKQIKVINNDD